MKINRRIAISTALLLLWLMALGCTPYSVKPETPTQPLPPGKTPSVELSPSQPKWKSSSSVGKPNNGSLRNGVQFLPRDGVRLNNKSRAWGTAETVALLNQAIDAMLIQYPGTCDIFMGDISVEHGGRLSPHSSHQSGRDVDVSLYAKNNCFIYFENMNSSNLDVEKTWYFIETLLMTGRVRMILMDYSLQKLFYNYLKEIYPQRKLAQYLQYPRPKNKREGIIRHAPSHGNHLHIRFQCSVGDDACQEW